MRQSLRMMRCFVAGRFHVEAPWLRNVTRTMVCGSVTAQVHAGSDGYADSADNMIPWRVTLLR